MSALAAPLIIQPSTMAKAISRLQASLSNFGLDSVMQRARRCLLSLQNPDGHWCGELQGDTILESEYILLMAFLGRETDDNVRKAANYILSQRRPAGNAVSA